MPGSAAREASDEVAALWERSVRATHTFLGDEDVAFYRPLVAQYLGASPEIWVLVDDRQTPLGFLGLGDASIDALFLEPDHRGRGWGRRFVEHAQQLRPGALTVDVNEQNDSACAFYRALGFVVVGRSAIDETGRHFPLLHLRRPALAP